MLKSKRKYLDYSPGRLIDKNYVSPCKYENLDLEYLDKALIHHSKMEYIPSNQIGLDKVKKQISNNLFKPLMNKELLSHQGAFPRSVLIYGPLDTGKNTMMKYIAHQLRWNVLSFNCIDMIGSEPSKTRETIIDTYYYCFNKGETILLF